MLIDAKAAGVRYPISGMWGEAEATDSGPVVYGDPNQGEGHVVHTAHVGSARKNLEWARGLGLVPPV